jgi:hypothetical protein
VLPGRKKIAPPNLTFELYSIQKTTALHLR